MRRRILLITAILAAFGALVFAFRPPPGIPSLSVQFVRYGSYHDYPDCAFITVSNSGTAPLESRGVGASYEQRLIRLWTGDRWVLSDRVWLSPGYQIFRLNPGESCLVPLKVET